MLGVLGTLLGLLLVALVSRSISRPLAHLAEQANDLATVHLPATLQAILADDANGIPQGVPITVSGQDEVSEVARALEAVQRTAIELGAGQVVLRRNLADAFVNLGRRNQNLVTRQLEYISDIELKEADPESLEELFRLDHLATRMRRNAESLLILAGSGPARQWSASVPAMDVARAASAEVEDYKRLRLHHFDPAMIKGEVTTDLVHILAELTENALTFSPPGSPVDVYGRFLDDGYVLVVVDSGIGMSVADLDIANQRLEGLGSDGDVPGRYLGHFVAGRLAARHDLAISLQASHSGGLVARVRIPGDLIEQPVADLSAAAELRSAPPEPAPSTLSAPPAPAAPVDISVLPADPFPPSVNGYPSAGRDELSPAGDDELSPAGDDELGAPPSIGADEAWYMKFMGPGADTGTDEDAPTDQAPEAPYGLGADYAVGSQYAQEPENHDLSDADLESLADNAQAWSDEVSPTESSGPGPSLAPASPLSAAFPLPAPPLLPLAAPAPLPEPPAPLPEPPPALPLADSGWDPVGGPGPAPVPDVAAYHAPSPAPALAPRPSLTDVALNGSAPRAQGTPDLGILSPLAGTVPAGGLLAWAQAPPRAAEEAPSVTDPLPGPTGSVVPLAPPAPAPVAPRPAATPLPAPVPAPAPTGAAAWNALPVLPPSNGVGPATQARSTADGLRKLTRRVPGASLPQHDDSLRRATPTTTASNPLGLTGALAQYLSATANNSRAEKEQNAR